MKQQLIALQKIEQLRSLKSQKKLAQLYKEEQDLRKQLHTLNEHRKLVHSTDTGLVPMRTIGADILWQGWIDRTQSDLNSQLARVMAKKEPVLKMARRDISRRDISEKIAQETISKLDEEHKKKTLNRLIEVAIVQKAKANKLI